jgi:hypothetical protein
MDQRIDIISLLYFGRLGNGKLALPGADLPK